MRYVGLGMDLFESFVFDVFVKMRNLCIFDCMDCEILIDDVFFKVLMNCLYLELICLNECKNYWGKYFYWVLNNCKFVLILFICFIKIIDEVLMVVSWEKMVVKEFDLIGCYFVIIIGFLNVIFRLLDICYFKMN